MNSSTIIRRAAFGSTAKFIQLALAVVTSFYLMPFLVHTLGTEQYGIWVLAGAFAGYYGFLDFGISTATGRFMASALGAGDNKKVNIISSSALAVYLLISLVIIVVTIASSLSVKYFVSTNADLFAMLILILGLGLAVQFPARSFGTILVGALRHDIMSIIEIITLLLRTGLILIFINFGYGILTLALITTLMTTLACVLNFFFMKKVFPGYDVRLSYVRKGTIKELVHYAKTMFVFTTTEMIKLRTIPFVVTSVVGVKLLVTYTIASTFINYFKEIITATTGMSYHITSRLEGGNNHQAIQKVLMYATAVATVISTYIATSLIVYGKVFITIWMGEEFIDSYHILVVLCIFEGIVFMMAPSLSAFAGLSKHKINATLNTIDVVLSLILAYVLGHAYGLIGIAVGVTLPLLIKIITIPYYTVKVLDVRFVDIYFKNMLPLAVTTSISIVVFNWIMNQIHSPLSYFDLILYNALQPLVVSPFVYVFLPLRLKQLIKQFFILHIKPKCCVPTGG